MSMNSSRTKIKNDGNGAHMFLDILFAVDENLSRCGQGMDLVGLGVDHRSSHRLKAGPR